MCTYSFAQLRLSTIRNAIVNADASASEAGNDTSLCRGEKAQIGILPDPNYNYSWSPATGLSDASISDPIVNAINDDSLTAYKKYYLTTTLKTAPFSSSTDSITVAVNPKPIAGNDTTVCKGSSLTLRANRALIYQWSPSTGLSNTTVQNPACTVNGLQTYHLTTINLGNNLISNGDFEQGNTAFTSNYIYCNSGGCLNSHSMDGYSVGADAKFFQGNFKGHDHTTGKGNFMIVNGAVPALTVWKQTINVIPNTTYSLSCWVSTMVAFLNTAQLRFAINNVQIDSIYNAPADTSVWKQFYATWNSGGNTTATIEITDVLNQSDGNDFGLDDIFLGPLTSCTDSIHIKTFSSTTVNTVDTICPGKADTLPSGKIVSSSGKYSDTLKNLAGCDSLITNLTLTVLNTQIKNISASVCTGQSYILPSGKTVSVTGIYNDTLKFKAGCDSAITIVNLSVGAPVRIDTLVSVCSGHSYILPSGNQIGLQGTYNDTVKSKLGCDSLISTVHLTVITSTSVATAASICKGVVYTLPSGATATTTGTYHDTLRNALGCDSLITTLSLNVFAPALVSKNITICNGQTYTMPSGIMVNTTGIYTDTLKSTAGCDSLITTLNLIVDTVKVLPIATVTICPGQTYTLPSGTKVSTQSVYKDTLQNTFGCDSLISTINLMVLSPTSVSTNASICLGQFYTMPSGITPNKTGIYTDTLKSVQGCDSLITTVDLTVISPISVTTNASICLGQFYTLPSGIHITSPGTYQDTLKNTFGCDSLITTTTLAVVFNGTLVNKSVSICLGQTYTMPSGLILTATGIFEDTLKSMTGCDSLITTVNLMVVSPISVSKSVSICTGEVYTMPSGLIINNTGVYKDTLKSAAGCDSLITTINLTVNIATSSSSTVSICLGQPYTLPSGQIVNVPGVYQSIIKNVNGCDSAITTTIENKPPLSINLSGPSTICAGDPASILAQVSGGNGGPYTYAWSGSAITNNPLIISPTADTKVVVTVSDGCTAPVQDSITILVNPRPPANFSVTPAAGCVPLAVTFNNSSSDLLNNSYTWNFGDLGSSNEISPSHIYNAAGNFDVMLIATNVDGCADSFKIISAVKALTQPVAAFTTLPSPNIFENAKIDFIDKSTGASSWSWLFGDGIGSSVQRDPTYVYQDSGTYKAMLIVTNSTNCADTAYGNIEIKGGSQIYIPNAFTPNGDNINDNFRIFGIGLKSVNMAIFNSWGEKIFQQTGNAPFWDGRYQKNGQDCDQGVFVYVIKATDKTGKVQSFKGTVTLLR